MLACAGGELSDDHAPEGLKPLLQPDSPLARLYEVCDTCEALSNTAAAANQVIFVRKMCILHISVNTKFNAHF